MSDAIIARRKGKGLDINISNQFRTELITTNTNWVVPSAINNTFSVRIFGGGGGTSANRRAGGGGGGWMNNADLVLTPGSTVQITIGAAGGWGQQYGTAGGTTTFGTYLSANGGGYGGNYIGGAGGSGGAGGDGTSGGDGYQFGGGAGGGDGGIWGGGGGGVCPRSSNGMNGGNGGMYGGGGGGGGCAYDDASRGGGGGNGGEYGGGGGGGSKIYSRSFNWFTCYTYTAGTGGNYGGNGGNPYYTLYNSNNHYPNANIGLGENGTNTIGWENVPSELQGAGRSLNAGLGIRPSGSSNMVYVYMGGSGGGGYGGNGGYSRGVSNLYGEVPVNITTSLPGGGGGGYGGHGGSFNNNNYRMYDSFVGGAGGGGYGGHGGNTAATYVSHCYGGSGGGYFGNGGYNLGGAGYYTDATTRGGAAYGNYGRGGYGGVESVTATPGVCIIQYYQWQIT